MAGGLAFAGLPIEASGLACRAVSDSTNGRYQKAVGSFATWAMDKGITPSAFLTDAEACDFVLNR